MATIRATLHHGDVYEVTTYRTADAMVTPADVVRALNGTAYGPTNLDHNHADARVIADELNAGKLSGRGWVHLELVPYAATATATLTTGDGTTTATVSTTDRGTSVRSLLGAAITAATGSGARSAWWDCRDHVTTMRATPGPLELGDGLVVEITEV